VAPLATPSNRRRRAGAAIGAILVAGAGAGCPHGEPPPGGTGCGAETSADERAFWQALAVTFQQCVLSSAVGVCRTEVERAEWAPVSKAAASGQELQGTIAPGGTKFASPGLAPEGDLCLSHDDIDFNFNVAPDAGYASLLQAGNAVADVDHPAGVIEGEWEAFYLDASYVAMGPGAGTTFDTWPAPDVDMVTGDRVAARGAGMLDCGHAPYRSEIHPPYLLLWGGLRADTLIVYARASALLARPVDYAPLPDPPDAAETLVADFALPPAPMTCPAGSAPALQLVTETQWLYDDPAIVVDQGCDVANGVGLTDLEGPAFDAALASPAAHVAGTSDPALAPSFFAFTATQKVDAVRVTLTPLARPHQVLFGARVTASWICS
jgi:hypothetical protein